MRCPFLQETWVKTCGIAPVRKFIPRETAPGVEEKCSSPAYVDCPLAREWGVRDLNAPSCPFLRTPLVQYCEQAPVPTLIPYNDALVSHCNSEAHRHCRLFREVTRAGRAERGEDGGGARADAARVEGVQVPLHLAYAPNHLWLDLGASGACFVGADALLAAVLGHVQAVTYDAPRGCPRPTAMLTVGEVELPLTLPNDLDLADVNAHLRSYPECLVLDPYGAGWLFEAYVPPGPDGAARAALSAGMVRGAAAVAWMREEIDRLSRFLHAHLGRGVAAGETLMADGGSVAPGAAESLDARDRRELFRLFFQGAAQEIA